MEYTCCHIYIMEANNFEIEHYVLFSQIFHIIGYGLPYFMHHSFHLTAYFKHPHSYGKHITL